MPRLVLIRDYFAPHRREIIETEPGWSIPDHVPDDFPTDRVQVIHNGAQVDHDAYFEKYRFATDRDEIVLRVVPYEPISFSTIITAVVVTLVTTGISIGINALLAPKIENRKKYDNTEESPTYSWDGIQNTTRNGEPVAICYGNHLVGGQYLATFTKQEEENKQTLYMLLGLCAGPICGVNDYTAEVDDLASDEVSTDLVINNNAADVFSDISVSYRMGEWDQSIIDGFRDSQNQITLSDAELTYNNAYVYTTTDEVQAIDLIVRFRGGLYTLDTNGAFLQYSVSFTVRYREEGTDTWTDHGTFTVSPQATRSEYTKYIQIRDLDSAKYQVEITRTTADDGDSLYTTSDSVLNSVIEITTDDVAYKGVALCGIKALATEQLNGRLPSVNNRVYGKECVVYQAGDDFGEDTQQDFKKTADGKRFWGWYAENVDYLTLANAHTTTPSTLFVRHGETASAWDSQGGNTAPRLYKKIYGDFDVHVNGPFYSTPANGDGIGLIVKPDGVDRWAHIGLKSDGTNYYWTLTDNLGSVLATWIGSVDSDETHYRVVKESSEWTFYTSTDGSTWTERGSTTYALPVDSEFVEVGVLVYSSTGNDFEVNFTDFEFDDETSYSVECTSNPSWVTYDLLTDETFGIGNYINSAQIDLDTFLNFAAFANEQVDNGRGGTHRRYRFDGILDAPKSAWEAVIDILANYRAIALKQGDKIRVAWLREQDPVQFFAMSNIREGSFKTSYMSPSVYANYWEVQYLNRENNFEQDYAVHVDPARPAGDPYRRKTLPLYGITRPAEAYRAALFNCKWNRYATQTVEFETGIEGITCEPYDVISVSHDVPSWGVGAGRVVGSTSTGITLDRTVTLEDGYTYVVKIRHKTDDVETQTVTNSAGTTNTITVAGWTNRPLPSAVWIVGKENTACKDFLVTKIERSNDLECKITGVEYNALIYDDTVSVVPTVVYTELPDPRKLPENISVSSLNLAERAQLMKDGTIQNVIDVTWSGAHNAQTYEVWYRQHGTASWAYGGLSRALHYVLIGSFATDTEYDIAVVSVGPWGAKRTPDASPYAQITVRGWASLPPDVTGLKLFPFGNFIVLKWTPVTYDYLLGYEVRIGEDATWKNATVLTGITRETQLIITEYIAGAAYFLVKAVNKSGLYSANAASISATLDGPSGEVVIVSRSEVSLGWTGTKTDCAVSGDYLLMDPDVTESVYETPEMDIGASVNAISRCVVFISQSGASTLINDIDLLIDSAWGQATYIDGGDSTESTATFTISYRFGNVSGSLGTYTEINADENLAVNGTGRYWQFKVTFGRDSTGTIAQLTKMESQVAVIPHVEQGSNVSVADSGTTTITFSSFNAAPTFTATVVGGDPGDYVYQYAISAAEVEVQAFDSSDIQIAATINWTATGY